MFVTMLIGIYDSNSNELLLANAGHEPPIIMDEDNNFSNFEEAGPPLGIIGKTEYKEYKSDRIQCDLCITFFIIFGSNIKSIFLSDFDCHAR